MKITTYNLPYLDLELLWNDEDKLESQVHWRKNQKLKYLNKGSIHKNVTFKEISSGWLKIYGFPELVLFLIVIVTDHHSSCGMGRGHTVSCTLGRA